MRFISKISGPTILFLFLFVNLQIVSGQVNSKDNKCTYNLISTKATQWFDGQAHRIQNLQNPKNKYKVGGILVYKDDLLFVNKHLRTVDLYKFDFSSKKWTLYGDSTLLKAMEVVYKDKALTSNLNAVELVGDTLFLCGLNKGPFYAINIKTKEEVYDSKAQLPNYKGSEVEAGIAFAYPYAYLAFHSLDYKRDIQETQRLFAIDVRTDAIHFDAPLNVSEKRTDGVHGITLIDDHVWHIKDNSLEKMSIKDGQIIDKYSIEDIKRPTSICKYKNSLWIITYYGGLYELALECK